MGTILEWGLAVVFWLQGLGAVWLGPMQFFTFLGTEEFYLLIAPALLWCVDPAWGLRLGLGLTLSSGLNDLLKVVFHSPRPFWYDARVQPLSAETSFGMPSGHAQNAVVVWGLFAQGLRRGWGWILALFLMFFIGLSRVYLGVHFPSDVLGGWLFGVLLLLAFVWAERALHPWLERRSLLAQTLAALSASLAMIAVGALLRLPWAGMPLPEQWVALAQRAPGGEAPQPYALAGLITSAAAFFGLAWGGLLLRQAGWFNAAGPLWKRLARFFIGLAGVLVLYMGLGVLFPRGEALLPYLLRYLRYALVGVWIAYLAPQAFIRLHLAERAA